MSELTTQQSRFAPLPEVKAMQEEVLRRLAVEEPSCDMPICVQVAWDRKVLSVQWLTKDQLESVLAGGEIPISPQVRKEVRHVA